MSKKILRNIEELLGNILDKKNNTSDTLIIGISGIDASGKGYISSQLAKYLEEKGISTYIENLDGWLNLPNIRFSNDKKGETFYQKGFRFEELTEQILIPYKINKKVNIEVDYIEETWSNFNKRKVIIDKVDVFILEGIFIFSEKILPLLDYKIWIDCSFETALKRAIQRNQEGLSNEEIIEAYHTRFFPAQKIHFEVDSPQNIADIIFDNDTLKK